MVTIVRRSVPVISEELNELAPTIAKIYSARGIGSKTAINRKLDNLLMFNTMHGLQGAVERLYQALINQQRILIVGDFDADGATSTAIAVKSLRSFGAQKVDYLVPNRFDFGYGLSSPLVDYAQKNHQPDLIVTVDNGIASVEGVARANEFNVDVIITDHHLAGESLPEAAAIVNPNQPDCHFASKNLAGVGVIFYTMLALRAFLREQNWFKSAGFCEPNLAELLDIVALGTVADVVPLDKNNRIMVHQGLLRMRKGLACPGIKALIKISGKEAEKIKASDLGFSIGPRLNAAGRLEDMSIGIECLLADSMAQAESLAEQLDNLNLQRRAIEKDMKQQAFRIVDNMHLDSGELPVGLCLYNKGWHQGIVGLLAGRIKEKVHRPVVCFAKGDGGELKGSARSIPGCHIRDALVTVNNQHPGIMSKFGGHAMAAGVSLPLDRLDLFTAHFNEAVMQQLSEEDLEETIYTDGNLENNEITLTFAEQINQAGPWGQAFPEPVFDGVFDVRQAKIVGEHHLKLSLANQQHEWDAIAFNIDRFNWRENASQIKAVYRLDINEFRGYRKLQLMIDYLEVI
jgi:single-stranded-DNA-specific exonuclease